MRFAARMTRLLPERRSGKQLGHQPPSENETAKEQPKVELPHSQSFPSEETFQNINLFSQRIVRTKGVDQMVSAASFNSTKSFSFTVSRL